MSSTGITGSGTVTDTLLTDFYSVLQSSTARKLWSVMRCDSFTWASMRRAAETHLTFAATEEIASFLKFFFLDTAVPMLQWNHQCVKSAHSTRHICNEERNAHCKQIIRRVEIRSPLSSPWFKLLLRVCVRCSVCSSCLGTRRPAEFHHVKFMFFSERSLS